MKRFPVAVKKDFIASISSASPIEALSELIWNGFDAGSSKVQVYIENNELGSVSGIRVRDFGEGIDHAKVEELFGSLGDSWKKMQVRHNNRALHGKNGKGRFKAFALGEKVVWSTTFKKGDAPHSFTISGSLNALDNFEASDPLVAPNAPCGTEVSIYNSPRNFRSLHSESVLLELAKIFGLYLTEYPRISLEFDGQKINPDAAKVYQKEYDIGNVALPGGQNASVKLVVVEWAIKTDRTIHLCDSDGVSLFEIKAEKIRAPGFHFTAYIKCDHIRELDKTNQLSMSELHPDIRAMLVPVKQKIKEHFRSRILEGQSKIVDRWKEEDIYPYEEKIDLDPLEAAERQVFDILAVSVQSYMPSFESADVKSKRFTFRLLAQAIKENPDSVQTIIGEVLGLKKQDQDDLAGLLRKTTLSSIISSAKIISDRLNFLKGIENLIFDKETKKTLLERDQLHKILEKEAWIFREEFYLAASEETLEDVLAKHIGLLKDREDDDPVDVGEGKSGRIDLMLQRAIQPRNGEYDYLVVELKRPSQKINATVLSQIEGYAMAVANDERFRGLKAKWTFMVISNDFDDVAKRKANQRDRPSGMVYDDADMNVSVWAKTWSEIISDAKSRLHFVNKQLSYQADRDSSKEYLIKTHAKYIPEAGVTVDENLSDEHAADTE